MKTINLLTIILFLVASIFASNEVCKQDKPYLPYYQKMQNNLPILNSDTTFSLSKSYMDLKFRYDDFIESESKNQVYNEDRRFFLKTNKICGVKPNRVIYEISDNVGNVYIDSVYGDSSYWWLAELTGNIENGSYNYTFKIKPMAILKYTKNGVKHLDTLRGLENVQYVNHINGTSIVNIKENRKILSLIGNKRDYLGRVNIRGKLK